MLVGLCLELVPQGVRLHQLLEALQRLEQAQGCLLIRHLPQLALLARLVGRADSLQIIHMLDDLFEPKGALEQNRIHAIHPALKGMHMCMSAALWLGQEAGMSHLLAALGSP